MTIPPGCTIGIVGGGQLGRMLAIAAAQLGYRSHIYAPGASGPATEVAAAWTQGAYEDADALAAFAATCDVVTYEFENLSTVALAALPEVRPCLAALETAQDRAAEKSFAAAHGLRAAPWMAVDDEASLAKAVAAIGAPAILKTRRFGYDGKGQARLATPADAPAAWAAIGRQPAVLEALVTFEAEFSVLLARAPDGSHVIWDPATNRHRDGVLAHSMVPAIGIVAEQSAIAVRQVHALAEALDYVGVLAVEFFAAKDGPIFNEMAPRVHNSGHWTIEGAETSQFENHVRAICGLPLGATTLTGGAVTMDNLIGAEADDWPALFAERGAHVHLYGKSPRAGRKMGHVTRVRRG